MAEGKIARLFANLLAIAARIDYFKGEAEEGLKAKLEEKLAELRQKYAKPPLPAKRGEKGYKRRRRA